MTTFTNSRRKGGKFTQKANNNTGGKFTQKANTLKIGKFIKKGRKYTKNNYVNTNHNRSVKITR